MIKFKCPYCDKDVSAADENAGKKGRCPGCKELFTIPAGAAAKPAPSAERRTPPADDEDEAPRKKKPADYDPDDPEAVEELKRRTGVKVVKRTLGEDDLEVIGDEDEAPRKKKPARDDEDDEAISEAPRKKRPARDVDEDDRPRKKRDRDDEDDDEPRARKKRGRDDDDDEDDRPRKKKKRRGQYATCPSCGCRGDASPVSFTWWGGILGPKLFSHVKCNRCGTCYNGKTGDYNTTKIAIYVGVSLAIGLGLVIIAALAQK
jgi:hypothetical protein